MENTIYTRFAIGCDYGKNQQKHFQQMMLFFYIFVTLMKMNNSRI